MKIDDDDVCEIIEEVNRRDKFDKEFDVELISEVAAMIWLKFTGVYFFTILLRYKSN